MDAVCGVVWCRDAVLHALEVMLTPRVFTEEARRAWCVAYSKIISVMIPLIAGESDKGHHVPSAVCITGGAGRVWVRNSSSGGVVVWCSDAARC